MSRVLRMNRGRARAVAPHAVALFVFALFTAGCTQILPGEPRYPSSDPSYATGPVHVIPASLGEATVRLDHANIVSASVEGDTLRLGVEFAGGCGLHAFSLLHDGVFMESYPVQARLQLAHDARGDSCRALVRRTLEFDLTPVRETYLAAYGTGGTLLLHVTAPGGGESVASWLEFIF